MQKSKYSAWLFKGAVLVVFSLLVSTTLSAGEEKKEQAKPQEPKVETVYTIRDQATGKMRAMTAVERDAAGLPALLARNSAQSKKQTTAQGVGSYHLNGGFQCAMVIKRKADGTFERSCVDGMHGLQHFMAEKQEVDHAR